MESAIATSLTGAGEVVPRRSPQWKEAKGDLRVKGRWLPHTHKLTCPSFQQQNF